MSFQELQQKTREQLKRDLEVYKKYGVKSDLIMRLENMGCKVEGL